jgi:hypothetical protein
MQLILILAMLILPLWASYNVKSTFSKYSSVHNSRGLTADQVARQILDSNGLYNVRVERISGNLTDHYDPRDNVVRLSDTVYGQTSVSAIGVAAHECGHACQHAEDYTPIKIRTAIVPAVNVCSMLWYFVFILGIILGMIPELLWAGIIMFAAVVLFQLVTLPVELDASGRALRTLENDMILDSSEVPKARKVLKAAAMTYVVALVTSLIQLLRLLAAAKRR